MPNYSADIHLICEWIGEHTSRHDEKDASKIIKFLDGLEPYMGRVADRIRAVEAERDAVKAQLAAATAQVQAGQEAIATLAELSAKGRIMDDDDLAALPAEPAK